jgi:hypothetical protein
MILLIRLVPFVVGLFEAVLFWQQRLHPELYPWLVLLAVALLPAGAFVIAWKRVRFGDLTEKMAPTALLLASLAFALLLVEGEWPLTALVMLASLASFLSLEVLFLLARFPQAYPVNGISRVNIGYVPSIVWYAISTSSGLLTFLHTDRVWHVALATVIGLIVFRTTGHPGATPRQNRIWMLVGGVTGFETGILGIILPLSMGMQGLIAALIICGVLRVRRYLYDPRPSVRIAWSELSAGLAVFMACLMTAKWL